MGMTHYMELMMGSWYLLVLFMALPMFLAECYVVSEILLLLKPREAGALKTFNKLSAYASAVVIAALSLYAATYFAGVKEWRTWVDVTAAVAYVAAGLPFLYVGLLEADFIGRTKSALQKGHAAVAAVVAYLILSHAAMVFGMFDPMQFGWQPAPGEGHSMMNHDMSAMNHGGHEGHAMPMNHGAHEGHAMPMNHEGHDRKAMSAPEGDHHCGDMPQDFSGLVIPEGHPIPEGYHRMPDGRLMKNGPMMMPPAADGADAPKAPAHHCGS